MRLGTIECGLLASVALLQACGCSSDDEEGLNVVAAAQMTPGGSWSPHDMPLKIRYSVTEELDAASEKATPEQFSAIQALAEQGLSETWGQLPGVSFRTVSSEEDVQVRIRWARKGRAYGETILGGTGVVLTADPTHPDRTKNAVVHEMGHVLGLQYLQQRPDAESHNCAAIRETVEACRACRDGVCTDPEFQGCTGQSRSGVPAEKRAERVGEIWGRIGPRPDAVVLTKHWDPYSSMNFCNEEAGRPETDYMPTPQDMLAMEMLYPVRTGNPIGCGDGCFYTDGGVIVRVDGSITTDWVARGSVDVIMRINGELGTYLTVLSLPNGESQQRFPFWDPVWFRKLWAEGQVIKANGVHTAVLNSLLM